MPSPQPQLPEAGTVRQEFATPGSRMGRALRTIAFTHTQRDGLRAAARGGRGSKRNSGPRGYLGGNSGGNSGGNFGSNSGGKSGGKGRGWQNSPSWSNDGWGGSSGYNNDGWGGKGSDWSWNSGNSGQNSNDGGWNKRKWWSGGKGNGKGGKW